MIPFGFIIWNIPPSLRFGINYIKTKRLLEASRYWSKEQNELYQLKELQRLIKHAYNNVPYYKVLFDKHDVRPEDIKNLSDIKQIPYLTKEIIQNNKDKLKARNLPNRMFIYTTTGGSTGIPLGFYDQRGFSQAREYAFLLDQWSRVGYKFNDRSIYLCGKKVKNIQKGKKYWEKSSFNNWLIMSSYHLNEDTAPLYIKKIREFKPRYIHCYPSALTILASYMEKEKVLPFKTVRAILCRSENIYDWQRRLFKRTFDCLIYSHYGHTEKCVLAGECENSEYHHCFPSYGFVELVNENDEWCEKEDEKGEIVATGFNNYAFPFIRYKTEDIGTNTNKMCECGRNWRLIKNIEGRLQDYVIGKNGTRLTLTALIFAQHFNALGKIKNLQLYQKRKGEVVVRIVENEPLEEMDVEEIINKMIKASDNTLEIEIKILKKVPRTTSGKYRFLIQELDTKVGDR